MSTDNNQRGFGGTNGIQVCGKVARVGRVSKRVCLCQNTTLASKFIHQCEILFSTCHFLNATMLFHGLLPSRIQRIPRKVALVMIRTT